MKLILTDDDGVLLDELQVTAEEWKRASSSGMGALSLLECLQPGDEALGGSR